jgi:folate-binding protein YgfZ
MGARCDATWGWGVSGLVWSEVARDFVALRGADAESFLQGQCSQDVERIDTGASAWSFLLQPSGKVDVLCRIHRVNDGTFVLDTDGGWGQAMLDRLERFKLRVKVELTRLGWRCLAVRGGEGPPVGPGTLVGWWGSLTEVDLVGDSVDPPAGAEAIGATAYERLRIEAGWPAMGAELTPATIPGEAGIVDLAASLTKGCYTGQELVARIDSRGGHVPRRLRRLRADEGVELAAGSTLVVDGKEAGWVTSAAGDVALAYVARAADSASDARVDEVPVHIEVIKPD